MYIIIFNLFAHELELFINFKCDVYILRTDDVQNQLIRNTAN